MSSISFTSRVRAHPAVIYVWLPLGVSLFLMGMYFSGVEALQNIIAPNIESIDRFSRREFGLLEGLQNLVLLIAAVFALRSIPAARSWFIRTIVVGVLAVTIFIFLEEIDYGAHFVDALTGQGLAVQGHWDRNLHNKTLADGSQLNLYFKRAADFGGLILFVIAPLLLHNSRRRLIRLLVPSRWIVATVAVMILLAPIAHWLDDAGFGVINGQDGNLSSNISEFRELNFYYLILLYVSGLFGKLRHGDI